MTERQMFALLNLLWRDAQRPEFLWQVLALAVSLALAWWLARLLRARAELRSGPEHGGLRNFGASGLKRIRFPLIALLVVVVCRLVLQPFISVSLLDLAGPLLLSLALVRATIFVLRRAFAPSGWLAVSERFIAFTIWLCLALYVTNLDAPLIDLLEQVSFRVGKQKLDLWMLLHGVVTVGATVLVALWLAGLVEHRLTQAAQMDSNMRVVVARIAKAVFSLLAVLFSLSLVGIDITALSVFGGAFAVGLGFGLQKIASNYVSGFIILLDRSIRIGNVISVDAVNTGIVTQITTRYTVVRRPSGTEVIIPNEYLVSNIVHNQSYTDSRVSLTVPVQVSYATDLDMVMRLIENVALAQERVLPEPAPKVSLTAFADSGINLELGFWINDPEAGTGGVRSAVNLAIWRAFREHGVEIPFPQREVRLLGNPPPAA